MLSGTLGTRSRQGAVCGEVYRPQKPTAVGLQSRVPGQGSKGGEKSLRGMLQCGLGDPRIQDKRTQSIARGFERDGKGDSCWLLSPKAQPSTEAVT